MRTRRLYGNLYGPIKFFRLKVLRLPNSDLPKYLEGLEEETKAIKDEIFRISWYMRGGVNSQDLFHLYSYEDRKIISGIIKENIEATKNSRMPLL
jgi:hypothetical protein